MSQTQTEEQSRIDRFKIAYNAIHHFMQESLHMRNEAFGVCLDELFGKDLINKKDYTFLDNCRQLRNFVVHNRDLYMAIPSEPVIERIELLASNFEKEPIVYPAFATSVQTINADDTMYRVMKIIEETQ